MKTKISILFLICVIFLTSGFGCANSIDKYTKKKMQPITLNYWRVWDEPDDFAEIINKYEGMHSNIHINYRKLRYSEFQKELLEALAVDRGPDMLSIHNTWIREYKNKEWISPMPEKITMIYPKVKGNIKKEVIYDKKTIKTITPLKLKNNFIDTVYDDVVIDNKIFGLPMFVDTMVMYYNRDLFNNAGITSIPKLWDIEFQQDVKKLTKQNSKGEIIQSGVALGGSENIERSTDILSILMMQSGAIMQEGNQIKFHQKPSAFKDRSYAPGADALRFYTDFSNPAKEVYSWNNDLDNSVDMFVKNKLAIMFGYSYLLPQIKSRAPKLNFGVSELLQLTDPEKGGTRMNFANYWVETVSSKSKHKEEAWDFIRFATEKKQAELYLNKTKKPTALRSLIETQLKSEDTQIQASQILTAKRWKRGNNANAMEKIMKEMINSAIIGKQNYQEIINLAASKVQQTINK